MSFLVWMLAVPAVAAAAAVARAPLARRALALSAALLAFAIASAAVALGVSLDTPLDGVAIAGLPASARTVCALLAAASAALLAVGVVASSRPAPAASPAAPFLPQPSARADRVGAALVGAGALLVVVGPHLALVAAGALLSAITAHLIARRWGIVSPVPVLPLLVASGVGVVVYYAGVIAGPVGLTTDALPDVPFSPSAAAMLAPFLALGAVGFFGLAPFGRMLPGPALAGIGVALLLRVGHVALREGLADWQTVLVPLGVAALWHAAVTRRVARAIAALAWLGAVAVSGSGASGAIWLAGAAALTALLVGSPPLLGRHPLALALAGAAAGWGGALVIDGLLRAEVVYAVLAWTAVLVTAWRVTPSVTEASAAG